MARNRLAGGLPSARGWLCGVAPAAQSAAATCGAPHACGSRGRGLCAGHRHVETLVSHDIVGRLMLMSVRQPGLANVYAEVLGFSGAEFYTEHWPQLVGKCFDDLQACFPDAVPIGVHTDDGILLNPPHNYMCAPPATDSPMASVGFAPQRHSMGVACLGRGRTTGLARRFFDLQVVPKQYLALTSILRARGARWHLVAFRLCVRIDVRSHLT